MTRIMGVDLGIRKVALFGLLDGQAMSSVLDLDKTTESRAQQLRILSSHVHDAMVLHDIDQVWIENTIIGNNRKYSLALTEVKGAVMASVVRGADVQLVEIGTWKKQVVGHGNATKDDVRNYIDVTSSAYAALCEDNQDLYDAACVALYGRHVSDQAVDLHLVP
jgi:Holliday junction resolvasome RuvABC endonuclease subunit